jgi:hypothetical protein
MAKRCWKRDVDLLLQYVVEREGDIQAVAIAPAIGMRFSLSEGRFEVCSELSIRTARSLALRNN